MSLSPGPNTFTRESLRKVWHKFPVRPSRYKYFQRYRQQYGQGKSELVEIACLELYESISQEPAEHLDRLDEAFEPFYLDPFPSWSTRLPEDEVIEAALRLLTRLPLFAPSILTQDSIAALSDLSNGAHSKWSPYTQSGGSEGHGAEIAWGQLCVSTFVNSVVQRIALHLACDGPQHPYRIGSSLVDVLNASLELLRVAHKLASTPHRENTVAWIIVQSFLWTSWQRTIMLYMLYVYDFSPEIEGIECIWDISSRRRRDNMEALRRTPYLCAWSYRSLLNNHASMTTDLRYFFEAYRRVHGQKSTICNGRGQCPGDSPLVCNRFVSKNIVNQSSHDNDCDRSCKRLFWDECSFRSLNGARAVRLETSNSKLRYSDVTRTTMAISHVWSHGQGGRPEKPCESVPEGTGLNLCLHNRYTNIARRYGCDSYWMDTPCIPSDKALRWECIQHIDEVFVCSRLTLICDRDIMDIDSEQFTLEVQESILATLLVCDWNIRGWTLLESMRGRANLHLLLKDNRTVPLVEVINNVKQNGRIDLCALLLNSAHIKPTFDFQTPNGFLFSDDSVDDLLSEPTHFVSVGKAAALLTFRHMTREQDDILIWGLLTGDTTFDDPIELWRSRIGQTISIGTIMSSSPRIKNRKGLGWAPQHPTVRCTNSNLLEAKAHVATLLRTANGRILEEGLLGPWFIHIFDNASLDMSASEVLRKLLGENSKLFERFALLQVCPYEKRLIPITYTNNDYGPLILLCGSSLAEDGWHWIDVFEWNLKVPLPDFQLGSVLLL